MAIKKNLLIIRGKTFTKPVLWGTEPIVYKQISGIQNSAPARITVTGHGLPDGWPVAITCVKGMVEINAEANGVRSIDYHKATVIDANTIDVNDINAAGFRPYSSGGIIQFPTPINITGYTARMSIKNKVGGTEIISLTTENGRLILDTARSVINLVIDATDTEAITATKGVYDLEMVSPTGVVSLVAYGEVTIAKEVTT